jgi:hypothetical protein
MKAQFEVWRYDFPGKGEHPVVLISPPDRSPDRVTRTSPRTSSMPTAGLRDRQSRLTAKLNIVRTSPS